MKPSLAYRSIEAVLRLTRYRNIMVRDAGQDRPRHGRVPRQVRSRWIDKRIEGQRVWVCAPAAVEARSIYVHFHGGGFVYGLQPFHFSSLAEVADYAGVTVYLPDYPLPPHRLASDIIDWSDRCYEACRNYGRDRRAALGGDSAGGNLALAILQKRAERHLAEPRKVVLWSPWVDLSSPDAETTTPDTEALITPYGLEAAIRSYVGSLDRSDPLVSPALYNVKRYPPLHIITGGKDILFPSINHFADRLNATDRLASLRVEPEYGHYWMFYPTRDRHAVLRHIARCIAPL
ncbi:MAG: alpha/beta hydrolase fold domain-containing protein [Pseudomonadota bacterium]